MAVNVKKFHRPKFVDITPETERLKDLDHFWILLDHCRELGMWRFSYVSEDETGEYIPSRQVRFTEPILMIHGEGTSHTLFNWTAREYWFSGFRFLFALDVEDVSDIQRSADRVARAIEEIKTITNAHRISVIAHSVGGVIARYYTKFTEGADSNIRILAMIGAPHDKSQFSKKLQSSHHDKPEILRALDYLEDINSTITEKELYYLTQVNIGGGPWTIKDKFGESRFIPLSDALNIMVSQTHMRIHRHKVTFQTLKPYLIPTVAVFKVRLLAISGIKDPLVFRIHYKGNITQKYPKNGAIRTPTDQSGPFLLEIPIIMFMNSYSLSQEAQPKIAIYPFLTDGVKQKGLGKIEMTIDCQKLPCVSYFTFVGENHERVDFAVYSYIP
ncbi:MAG: alpha/beta hydrolase [Candidatus Heimdallarchaeota archaeon]|nr:alpha/beta hydrolase [Candidatus Heimdallarchaeota archaeon]